MPVWKRQANAFICCFVCLFAPEYMTIDNSMRVTLNSIEKRQAVAGDNDYMAPIASIEFIFNGSMVSHKQWQIPRTAYCVCDT